MIRTFTVFALLAAALAVPPASFSYDPVSPLSAAPVRACRQPNKAVAEYTGLIAAARKNQPELAEALRLFPKGADLHNHLSGAVRPEQYLALGMADGVCFGPDRNAPGRFTLEAALTAGGCGSGFKPLRAADEAERTGILRSLSLYQYDYPDIQGGHDQFFATFGRFNAVSSVPCNKAPLLADLLRQAAAENVSYVETMLSFQSQAVKTLAGLLRRKFPAPEAYRDSAGYPALYGYLLEMGLRDAVAGAHKDLSGYVNKTNALLRCGSREQDSACAVSYAFLAEVNRNAALQDGAPDLAGIFTRTAFSMLLAATDSRVVGVNLVSGEDAPVAMGSFDTQMQFFSYFHQLFPGVNIALHAGEFTPCFIGDGNPALKNHLTGSLNAGAKRIGHGVSFAFLTEKEKAEVAALMKGSGALVETLFTSNAQILGVAGAAHPFPQYAAQGVPLALATDDEGVSSAGFTDEWLYGYLQYKLTRSDLETLGRNSLQYSFIPGAPLWADLKTGKPADQCAGQTPGTPDPAEPCRSFLSGNAKARAQWEYEARLKRYWQTYGERCGKFIRSPPGGNP